MRGQGAGRPCPGPSVLRSVLRLDGGASPPRFRRTEFGCRSARGQTLRRRSAAGVVQGTPALPEHTRRLAQQSGSLAGVPFGEAEVGPGLPRGGAPRAALPHACKVLGVGKAAARLHELSGSRAGDGGGYSKADRAGAANVAWPQLALRLLKPLQLRRLIVGRGNPPGVDPNDQVRAQLRLLGQATGPSQELVGLCSLMTRDRRLGEPQQYKRESRSGADPLEEVRGRVKPSARLLETAREELGFAEQQAG